MMKGFEPSQNFTARTMLRIRAYERESRKTRFPKYISFTAFINNAIKLGTLSFGFFHLIRIYLAVFSPSVCY
jgi:hypothetical protein